MTWYIVVSFTCTSLTITIVEHLNSIDQVFPFSDKAERLFPQIPWAVSLLISGTKERKEGILESWIWFASSPW